MKIIMLICNAKSARKPMVQQFFLVFVVLFGVLIRKEEASASGSVVNDPIVRCVQG